MGNITSKTTEHGGHLYGYDSTYQLTAATNPVLPAETYSYDKTGNRLSATVGSDTKSYSHNGNNEMTAVGGVSYTYDANGNMTSRTSGGQTTTFTYNSADRLEAVHLPDGRTAAYIYDPFGRRIKKQVGTEITYYQYSNEGLIGEYDAVGNLKKSYGWQPGSLWGTNPVFMTENGQYYFYQNDHLGTPQKITDEGGNVVWGATYTAFGKAIVDPASAVINNLRFPGQYYDEETGSHYNWNRHYDPETGKYIQVDPIGFAAGDVNLYRYVQNNPVNWVDPWGLTEDSPANIARRNRIADIAENYAGTHFFDKDAYLSSQYPKGSWKCSGFVCSVLSEAGAPLMFKPKKGKRRCPTAGELANKRWKPKDWRILGPNEQVYAGDIPAYPLTMLPGERDIYSGHTGIMTTQGGMGAHIDGVYVVPNQYATTVPGIIYRRYTGE